MVVDWLEGSEEIGSDSGNRANGLWHMMTGAMKTGM
jgi:hypothetical protein